MPDALAQALAVPGLGWMALTIVAAGLVRGFTGFGTALILVPVAGQFLPPAQVILLLATTGMASTAALLPRAWVQADRGEVAWMAAAAALTVPLGIFILTLIDPLAVRWIVAAIASVTLAAIVTGWRWQGRLGPGGRLAVGGAAGLVGGLTGLTGPVVIVFYLANARSATAVRANTILFLALLDAVMIVNLVLGGFANGPTLWIALILSLPYLGATLTGQALFDPARERLYRVAAYLVIAGAVLSGLPLFD